MRSGGDSPNHRNHEDRLENPNGRAIPDRKEQRARSGYTDDNNCDPDIWQRAYSDDNRPQAFDVVSSAEREVSDLRRKQTLVSKGTPPEAAPRLERRDAAASSRPLFVR
jgi:hypothetical protein